MILRALWAILAYSSEVYHAALISSFVYCESGMILVTFAVGAKETTRRDRWGDASSWLDVVVVVGKVMFEAR